MMSPTILNHANCIVGKNISRAEIANISEHGIWLLVRKKEYFLAYDDYPWFKKATVEEILDVQFFHGFHLRWPRLDIDLELESLENREKYPLRYTG